MTCLLLQRQTWTESIRLVLICITWAKILYPYTIPSSLNAQNPTSAAAETKILVYFTVQFWYPDKHFVQLQRHNLCKNMKWQDKRLNLSAYTKHVKSDCHPLLPVWIGLNCSLCFPIHWLDAIKCHETENYSLYC